MQRAESPSARHKASQLLERCLRTESDRIGQIRTGKSSQKYFQSSSSNTDFFLAVRTTTLRGSEYLATNIRTELYCHPGLLSPDPLTIVAYRTVILDILDV